jgi:hypothetical protein
MKSGEEDAPAPRNGLTTSARRATLVEALMAAIVRADQAVQERAVAASIPTSVLDKATRLCSRGRCFADAYVRDVGLRLPLIQAENGRLMSSTEQNRNCRIRRETAWPS